MGTDNIWRVVGKFRVAGTLKEKTAGFRELLSRLANEKAGIKGGIGGTLILLWFMSAFAWIAVSALLWSYWVLWWWLWPEKDLSNERDLWLSISAWLVLSLGAFAAVMFEISKIRR